MKGFDFILNIAKHVKTLNAHADSVLTCNATYLKNGTWFSDGTNTVLYEKESRAELKTEAQSINGINFKRHDIDLSTRIAFHIHKRFYRFKFHNPIVNKKSGGINGNIIIVSTNGTILRIVDYEKSLMLTKYDNIKRLELNNRNRERFGKYFNTVPLYECNYDGLYTVEKYIIRQRIDSEDLFRQILSDRIEFSKNGEYIVSKAELHDLDKSKITDLCIAWGMEDTGVKLLDLLQSNRYIKTMNHCDMSRNNVIYDGDKCYYIDFECLDEKYPLYDVLQFLFYSTIERQKPGLNEYLRGNYDEEISLLLSNYGIKYNSEDRKLYLFLYLLENRGFDTDGLKNSKWLFSCE